MTAAGSTESLGFTEEVELSGHIVDSLLLPKVLDQIICDSGLILGLARHTPPAELRRTTAPIPAG